MRRLQRRLSIGHRHPPLHGNLAGYRPFDDLSGDLGNVLCYVAVNLLFTTSPLYKPAISPPDLPEDVQLDINRYLEGDAAYEVPVFALNATDELFTCCLGFAADNWSDGTQSFVILRQPPGAPPPHTTHRRAMLRRSGLLVRQMQGPVFGPGSLRSCLEILPEIGSVGVGVIAIAAVTVFAPLATYHLTHPGSFLGHAISVTILDPELGQESPLACPQPASGAIIGRVWICRYSSGESSRSA